MHPPLMSAMITWSERGGDMAMIEPRDREVDAVIRWKKTLGLLTDRLERNLSFLSWSKSASEFRQTDGD